MPSRLVSYGYLSSLANTKDYIHYNGFAPEGEYFARSFTFDIYVQAIRRMVSSYFSGNVEYSGYVQQFALPLLPSLENSSALALLYGESNRMAIRYPLLSDFLDNFSYGEDPAEKNIQKTPYYQYLYDRYRFNSNCNMKQVSSHLTSKCMRVLRIRDYMLVHGANLSGLTYFLKGSICEGHASPTDYPIVFVHGLRNHPLAYSFFDGSHRRCIAAYLGLCQIESIVVNITDITQIIYRTNDSYLMEHHDKFINLYRSVFVTLAK